MITMLAFAKLMGFLQICQQNLYPLPCCISIVYLKATKPSQVQNSSEIHSVAFPSFTAISIITLEIPQIILSPRLI